MKRHSMTKCGMSRFGTGNALTIHFPEVSHD